MNSFVSLNSWSHPGLIHQAESPVEVVTGGPGDWDRLRAVRERYRRTSPDAAYPEGALIGYFTYEGAFWFGVYPRLRRVPAEEQNAAWKSRSGRRSAPCDPVAWQSNFTRAAFEAMVERAREYIRAGDIYQVNLAQRFEAPFDGDPYLLFEQLAWRSPAPGSAFLDTGERQILSSSPELFLRIDGRRIITQPIKGTRPRDRDPLRDAQLAYELQTDPKELAELVMITDLERNDLGQVCEFGSVGVPDLCRLERYPQLYHLVSTVEGMLRPDVDALDALAACFPGGSITGAPKKRSREIIAELEPEQRGVYTGAIGYFSFSGDAAFNIAIRTMVQEAGRLHFHTGAGITVDSVPAREYEETLHKAVGMKLAVEAYTQLAGTRTPSL